MSRGIPGYPGGPPRGSAGEAGPVPPRPLACCVRYPGLDSEDLHVVTSPEIAEAYAAHWRARQAVSVRFADASEWCHE
jgi:hypothetical protein